jgi:hypothetical protein
LPPIAAAIAAIAYFQIFDFLATPFSMAAVAAFIIR